MALLDVSPGERREPERRVRSLLSGDEALVRCYGVAVHHRAAVSASPRSRIFVGTYEIRLSCRSGVWLIRALTFDLRFIDGNTALETATWGRPADVRTSRS